MFEQKKQSLFETKNQTKPTSESNNAFINGALKKSAETKSGNGALKYNTTGNEFVDQFGQLGKYKSPRKFSEIANDCEILWASNKLLCVIFIFYIRMITRVTNVLGIHTDESQKGAGLKHEAIMRMLWLSQKSKQTFEKNIILFTCVGSWKDLITMMQYDLVYNGWGNKILDWPFMAETIFYGLQHKETSELVKKYLPQLRARSKCTTVEAQADTMIAKYLCSFIYEGSDEMKVTFYKKYRQMKSSGTAHQWQQLISKRKFNSIDFNKIHGRALNLLVKGKFLANHGLVEKYNNWISKPDNNKVKYTGFVHELMETCAKYKALISMPKHEQETINKQFATLIEKGGSSTQSSLIVVRDTSGSMASTAEGTNMSCYDIAKSLALYFSYFLKGSFENAWIEFNSIALMHQWKGDTPCAKWFNDKSNFYGSTNFQSVIDLFCKLKKQGISESEFPTGILCVSDGEFNKYNLPDETNYAGSLIKLKQAGFSKQYIDKFVMVFWNLQSKFYGAKTGCKFETYGNVPNVYYFSGYEPSIISFLTSEIKNAEELFYAAMNQYVLKLVVL